MVGEHRHHHAALDTVTTPLLKTVQSRKVDPARLITHRFTLYWILDA